jgi:predicted phage-related endonuclease
MKILNLTQGSPEWLATRAQHFCASDAPAMMGVSKYKTRSDLLREKATLDGSNQYRNLIL